MDYFIEYPKEVLYPTNPPIESVRRNPEGTTITTWKKLTRHRRKISYDSKELAKQAAKRRMDGPFRIVNDDGDVLHEETP